MSECHERLRGLIDAIEIHGHARFRLAGEDWLDLAEIQAPPGPDPLCAGLTGHLYNRAHAGGWPAVGPSIARAVAPDPAFVARLSAPRAQPLFDPGWQLQAVESDGSAVCCKGAWTRRAAAGAWLPQGQHCALALPRPHVGAWGSFVYLYGRTLGEGPERGGLMRVYLHTRAPAGVELIEALMHGLDRGQVPFVLKTVMAPALVERTDATVLYVQRRYRRVALGLVRRLGAQLDTLGAATAVCALRLRAGVAVAEDTGTSESFGMQRMRLIAEGVLSSVRSGSDSPRGRLASVAGRFASAGLSLSSPHLSPHSRADYFDDWTS